MSAIGLTRLITGAVALLALVWSIVVFPTFWFEAPLVQAARHIVRGERYQPETLNQLSKQAAIAESSWCFKSIDKLAILRLRQAEYAITSGDQLAKQDSIDAALAATKRALASMPTEAFQWLALFWLMNEENGFSAEHLRFLRKSYEYGPHEGWIAVKRLPLMLSLFSSLDGELRDALISEYARLVSSDMYDDAVEIADRAGQMFRYVLFNGLRDVRVQKKQIFAKRLIQREIDDAPIPGIDRRPARPWR